MDFDVKRLNLGEQIAAGGAIALFIFFFFFHWFGPHAGIFKNAGLNGWDSFSLLRWLVLLTILGALAHAGLKATKNSIDLPVAPGLILTILGGLTTILIAYRMLIDQPGFGVGARDKDVDLRFASWLGLLSLIAITVGAWLSMGETASEPAAAAAPPSAPQAPAAPAAPAAATPRSPDPGPPPAAATPPPPPAAPPIAPPDPPTTSS